MDKLFTYISIVKSLPFFCFLISDSCLKQCSLSTVTTSTELGCEAAMSAAAVLMRPPVPGAAAPTRTQSEIITSRAQGRVLNGASAASFSSLDLRGSGAPTSPRQPQSPSAGGGKSSGQVSMHSLYKTELCRSWEETGSCRYGSKCQFAHGKAELRPIARHPKYKTEICRTFATNGTCPYGTRCRFIHYVTSKDIEIPIKSASAGRSNGKASRGEPPSAQKEAASGPRCPQAPGQTYDTWSELLDESKAQKTNQQQQQQPGKVKRTRSAFPRLEQQRPGADRAAPEKTKSQRLPIFQSLSLEFS